MSGKCYVAYYFIGKKIKTVSRKISSFFLISVNYLTPSNQKFDSILRSKHVDHNAQGGPSKAFPTRSLQPSTDALPSRRVRVPHFLLPVFYSKTSFVVICPMLRSIRLTSLQHAQSRVNPFGTPQLSMRLASGLSDERSQASHICTGMAPQHRGDRNHGHRLPASG